MKHPYHIYRFFIVVALTIALVATSSGCATPSDCASGRCRPINWTGEALPDDVRRTTSTVSVASSSTVPTGTFQTFAKGRGEGFAKGAENGATKGAKGSVKAGGFMIGAGLEFTFDDPAGFLVGIPMMVVGLAVVVATPVVAIVGGIGGGVVGSVRAVSEDAAKKIDDTINATASDSSIQNDLSEQLIQTGENRTDRHIAFIKLPVPATEDIRLYYRSLGLPEKSIIVEIGLNRLTFLGGSGSDPLVMMQLETEAKVISAADGSLFRLEVIPYTSVPRRSSAWTAEGSPLLKQELASAYKMITEDLVDELFLGSDHGSRIALSGYFGREYCVMQGYTGETTGSLRPMLQWQPFMRALQEDKPWGADISSKISNVTYDILIWKAGGVPSEERVYERRGITSAETMIKARETFVTVSPYDRAHTETYSKEFAAEAITHTVEADLQPSTEYYWSVRARYTLDGQTNISRWSRFRKRGTFSKAAECSGNTNDLDFYYRFVTPEAGIP